MSNDHNTDNNRQPRQNAQQDQHDSNRQPDKQAQPGGPSTDHDSKDDRKKQQQETRKTFGGSNPDGGQSDRKKL